jgi:hypothetical protein
MNITPFSHLMPTTNLAGASIPFLEMASKIGKVYADSMQASGEQLWMSSARIIQQHTVSAMMNTSQACIEALAKNVADSQQHSFARLGSANQKVFEIMTGAFAAAMLPVFKPAD